MSFCNRSGYDGTRDSALQTDITKGFQNQQQMELSFESTSQGNNQRSTYLFPTQPFCPPPHGSSLVSFPPSFGGPPREQRRCRAEKRLPKRVFFGESVSSLGTKDFQML